MPPSKRDLIIIKYDEEGKKFDDYPEETFKFKAEKKEADNRDDDNKTDIFETKENHVIIKWTQEGPNKGDEDKMKKTVIQDFERFSKQKEYPFYLMWKSSIKYLLFHYSDGEDRFISKYLEDKLLENPVLIVKIIELKNKFPEKEKNFFDLVKNVFTNKNFDISKHEKFEEKNDHHNQLKYFLNILLVEPKEDKENKENKELKLKSNFSSLNQEDKTKILEAVAKQFMKVKDSLLDFGKELYFCCLENNIDILSHFKKSSDKLFEKIQKEYKDLKVNEKEISEKIINDLFAMELFSKCETKTKKYCRLPLWKIIQLYYEDTKAKNHCIDYFKSINNKNITTKDEEDHFKKSCSCLNTPTKILFSDFHENIWEFFWLDRTTFSFKFPEKKIGEFFRDKPSQLVLKTIENVDVIKNKKNLIIKLIENKVKTDLKKFVTGYKSNDELYEKLNSNIKNIFWDYIISLDNKSIFTFNGNNFEKAIEEDIFRNRTLQSFFIDKDNKDSKDITFSEMINSILKDKKNPTFLTTIQIDNKLKLDILKSKEPFLNNKYILKVLEKVIELDSNNIAQNSKQNKSINMLAQFFSNFEKIIVKLHLLHTIHELSSKILENNEQLNENFENFYTNNPIKSNNVNDFIVTEFGRIIGEINKSKNSKMINKKNYDELIEKCIEFSSQNDYYSEDLLELESCYFVKKYNDKKNRLFNDKHEGIKLITNLKDKNFSPDKEIFKDSEIEKFVEKDKISQFMVSILRIIFYHSKFNKETNSNEKDKKLNLDKKPNLDIYKIISKDEYLFESISLIKELIEEVIPIQIEEMNNQNKVSIINYIKREEWEVLKVFKQFVEKVKNKNVKLELVAFTKKVVLIICLEKILLNTVSARNVVKFDENWFKESFEESIKLIEDFNIKLINEDGEVSFEHYVAIAFLKLFAHVYVEVLVNKKDNSSFLQNWSDYLTDNPDNVSVKILQFYILKIIRNKYCNSFNDFRNFNFSDSQIIWTSQLRFQGQFHSEFEYLFFSDWNIHYKEGDKVPFFDEYERINTETFAHLREESFRTSNYDSTIKDIISNSPDLYVDLIMNNILCNTWDPEYRSKMDYIEFCSWSKHLLNSIKLNEELKKYLFLLSLHENLHNYKGFKVIIETFNHKNNEVSVVDLEIILMSLKFALVSLLVNNLNIIASAEQQVQNQLQYELITKLETFIRDSIQFYKEPKKDKCLALINNYKELQTLLRMNNICQIKLFLNLLYYLIKNQPPQDSLYSKIEQAIACWPSQGPFIKIYKI